MIPKWKVRLLATYGAVFFIIGLACSFMVGRYWERDAFDRGVLYGASLPCPTGAR